MYLSCSTILLYSPTGVIDVTNAFDYETTKTWEFTVTGVASIVQNPEQTVTMYARVIIIVRDIDDNCPTFTTPSVLNLRYSSPIQSNTIIGRVKLADADSQMNHDLSVTDSSSFQIDGNGNIMTNRILDSLTQQNYSFNVTATTNNGCNVKSQVALTLDVCPPPMTYMFTDNANYEETVYENKTVVSAFSIVARIQGSYSPVVYSIVESTSMFSINPNSGTYQSTLISKFLSHILLKTRKGRTFPTVSFRDKEIRRLLLRSRRNGSSRLF